MLAVRRSSAGASALRRSRRATVAFLSVEVVLCQICSRFALPFALELPFWRFFALWQAVQPGSVRFQRGVILLRSKVCVASGLVGCSLLDEVLSGVQMTREGP